MSKCLLPPPLHSHPLCRRLLLLQGSHLLFKPWNKRNTGLMLQPPPLPPQSRKTPQKLENRRHPLNSLSGNWSKRLGSSLSLTQQQNRTTSWAQHWDAIPFSFNRKSRIGLHLSSSQWLPTYLVFRLPRTTQ